MVRHPTSHEVFESYAAMDAPDLPANERSALQVRLARWEVREFGYQPIERAVLGIGEEIGELAGATSDGDREDAVADILIYAMQVATAMRLDFWALAAWPWDWDETPSTTLPRERVPALAVAYGAIAHAVLKRSQGIRGMTDEARMRSVVQNGLGHLCVALGPADELWAITAPVAEQVMRRKWRKDPVGGGA
jgi:NTP pyrophosphatase (non-canonical NTP hydrolase)